MLNQSEGQLAARMLLEIAAVHYYRDKPFVFTSGTSSPVYVDCRKLISFPAERRIVLALAQKMIARDIGQASIDVIAGGETAGIPYAAWLSQDMNLPAIYVRKAAKGFGRLAQIEGDMKEGASVLLIEDLMFDAKSKVNFCEAIRKAGGEISHACVLFDYGIPKSREVLASHNLQVHAITNWTHMLTVAAEMEYFTESQRSDIKRFLDAPNEWSS